MYRFFTGSWNDRRSSARLSFISFSNLFFVFSFGGWILSDHGRPEWVRGLLVSRDDSQPFQCEHIGEWVQWCFQNANTKCLDQWEIYLKNNIKIEISFALWKVNIHNSLYNLHWIASKIESKIILELLFLNFEILAVVLLEVLGGSQITQG